jgi:predicted transcriptional regulator
MTGKANSDDSETVRHQLTLEALKDVDDGYVIDHRMVQAWVDSLGIETASFPPHRNCFG